MSVRSPHKILRLTLAILVHQEVDPIVWEVWAMRGHDSGQHSHPVTARGLLLVPKMILFVVSIMSVLSLLHRMVASRSLSPLLTEFIVAYQSLVDKLLPDWVFAPLFALLGAISGNEATVEPYWRDFFALSMVFWVANFYINWVRSRAFNAVASLFVGFCASIGTSYLGASTWPAGVGGAALSVVGPVVVTFVAASIMSAAYWRFGPEKDAKRSLLMFALGILAIVALPLGLALTGLAMASWPNQLAIGSVAITLLGLAVIAWSIVDIARGAIEAMVTGPPSRFLQNQFAVRGLTVLATLILAPLLYTFA